MAHKWDKHYRGAFIVILVTGIALCIGGIWLPPLLVPGGVFIAGALSFYASAYVRMYPWEEAPLNQDSSTIDAEHGHINAPNQGFEHINNVQINIDDHHVEFHPHFDMHDYPRRPHRPGLEDEVQHIHSAPQLTLS